MKVVIKRITQLLLSLLLCLLPFYSKATLAQTDMLPSTVVINEIQTGKDKAIEEFIEVANISTSTVDISGWKLRYFNSSGSSIQILTTFPDGSLLYPGGFIVVAPAVYMTDLPLKISYTSTTFGGVAATGGTVSLISQLGIVYDTVSWGTSSVKCMIIDNPTVCIEAESAAAPAAGNSIQRKIIETAAQDTNNNKNDFESLTIPTPTTQNIAPPSVADPDPEPLPDPDPATLPDTSLEPASQDSPSEQNQSLESADMTNQPNSSDATQEITNASDELPQSGAIQSYLPIYLNELMVDPATPLTDAHDEWVELYNPSNQSQNLQGYTIVAGDTTVYKHTFPSGAVIEPMGYIVVTSADTSLALANGGSVVKIVDPTGVVIDQTAYDTAVTGQTWAKNSDGLWVWTSTSTESAPNIITQPTAQKIVATALAAKKATTKAKTTAKKVTTSKTTAPKSAAATKVTKVKSSKDTAIYEPATVPAPSPMPAWLLAVLGILAVIYSGYEYRFDITNKIHQLSANREARRINRR